ncbi:MAG: hypothetical protein EOP04_09755 [Proteobacteria bacterium]|nr:MAG: hypothetical protein EOP04_09755 [Pseudomonadota bacterium]
MNVSIIDDDKNAANITKIAVEDAGYDPLMFDGPTDSIKSAAEFIMAKSEAAVCDHRLRPGGLANFDGAELVAHLIGEKFPAILISQFVNQDYDVSIRHWRAILPSVISRDDLEGKSLEIAIDSCKKELSGVYSTQRRAHRTIVQILDTGNEDNQEVVDVLIPSWLAKSAVRFPKNIIPNNLQHLIRRGEYLIAYINLGAQDSRELYFNRFEAPSTPNESIFDNL